MYQFRRLLVFIELTVVMSAVSLLYSLLSVTTYSSRSVQSHRSLSVDNESAVSRVDVSAAMPAIDQYGHYTTPLSSHAKDALDEMKFLRQRQNTTVVPRNVVNAIGKQGDQSGLTSLSPGVGDNQRLPAPVGRRLSRVVSRGRRPQSAAVVQPHISTDELMKSHTTSDCTMLLSNTSSSHVIPHVLHQTSDDVTVIKQVRVACIGESITSNLGEQFSSLGLLVRSSLPVHFLGPCFNSGLSKSTCVLTMMSCFFQF